ncbi:helix-turn-helix domain-containing protein [Spirillospora sp. NPDC052242]
MDAKQAARTSAQSGRKDARRNHARLLATARELFLEQGADASLDALARRAGVGIGTLYRHFPTRQNLLEALLTESYDNLSSRARELTGSASPEVALTTWLQAFITEVTEVRGMAASVMATLRDERSEVFTSCTSMRAAGEVLFREAQRAGLIPPEVEFLDVLRLVGAIAMAAEQEPDVADRLLALALRGLMPGAETPVPAAGAEARGPGAG